MVAYIVVITQSSGLSPLAKKDLVQTLAYILKHFRFPDTFLILYKPFFFVLSKSDIAFH